MNFLPTEKINRIEMEIRQMVDVGKSMFITSSFQSHSIPLLHLMSKLVPGIPVYFLETNFHFPETIRFRDDIRLLLGLNLLDLRSEIPISDQKDENGDFLHKNHKDRCCHINKVEPMEPLLNQFDIWISGVRADQTKQRSSFERLMSSGGKATRYHPMLDWTTKDIFYYRKEFNLPEHPLEAQGFPSIGCAPCTAAVVDGMDERSGRWAGVKDECGLHTTLTGK